MLRLICGVLLLLSAGAFGCGGGTEAEVGGSTVFIEPGPTCTAFCALAVGDCEVTELGDDAACKQDCEQQRALAGQTSEACLEAFEAAIDCSTELDCQHIYDRINRVNLESYPCLPELENSDLTCTRG